MTQDYPLTDSAFSPLVDRDRALAEIDAHGMPQYRTEHWKYTNPKPLIEWFDVNSEGTPTPPTRIRGSVEVMPFCSTEARQLIGKHVGSVTTENTTSMPSLNLLNATYGYVIRATASDCEESLVRIEPNPGLCERILVLVETGANLKIVESTQGGNRVLECIVADSGSLLHTRLQRATTSMEYSAVSVQLRTGATYRLDQYSSGTNLRRNEISIDIVGESSSTEIKGGWRLEGKSHLDSQVSVNHRVPRSKSQTKFHGVVAGDSRAVFNGRIYIAPEAQQTSAHLNNKNIVIGERAEVFTKPELEIYADDVVCSHGATSGQLDKEQLFYMRTRGLANDRARELLLNGFLQEVIDDELGTQILGIRPLEIA